MHQRHTCLATDQDDIVDVAERKAGILHCNAARTHGALDQFFNQRFQFGARDLLHQVIRPSGVCSDVRQIHVALLARRQFDLALLGRFLQALHGQRITAQVHALLFFKLISQIVDDAHVEVLAAEEGVAIGRQHFELLLAIDVCDLDDRHVEGATAQVIHRDLGVRALLVQTVGQRCRSGLVDDAFHIQARNAAGILRGLTL